jgi:hypothetical protein
MQLNAKKMADLTKCKFALDELLSSHCLKYTFMTEVDVVFKVDIPRTLDD